MSITATSLFSLGSTAAVITTSPGDTVGIVKSPFSAYLCCFLPPSQALTLIVLYLLI